jgi:ferrous iron transport protein A
LHHTLDKLAPGERSTVLGVDAGEALYHRLAALGLRIGEEVQLLRRAPFGGPLQVRLGMTDLMLRVEEARCVRVAGAMQECG